MNNVFFWISLHLSLFLCFRFSLVVEKTVDIAWFIDIKFLQRLLIMLLKYLSASILCRIFLFLLLKPFLYALYITPLFFCLTPLSNSLFSTSSCIEYRINKNVSFFPPPLLKISTISNIYRPHLCASFIFLPLNAKDSQWNADTHWKILASNNGLYYFPCSHSPFLCSCYDSFLLSVHSEITYLHSARPKSSISLCLLP